MMIKAEKTWWIPKVQASTSLSYMGFYNTNLSSSKELMPGTGAKLDYDLTNLNLLPIFQAGIGFKWDVFDGNEGKPGQVTLNSAKTGLITAATPEELLEKATGWQAPIMHLAYWVQAKPATQNAQASKDEQNRLKQLIEDGWTVDFSYNDKQILPNKLLLKQALADDKENRITMVIQNR
jgi:hypothetical protein